jgi:DUF1016 N-terminal domain
LAQSIQTANKFFLDQTQRQVNTSLTLQNWVIGYYIVEYEQKGEDRAAYGGKLIAKLAERVKKAGIKGLSYRYLQLFKQFYSYYPQLATALAKHPQLIDNKMVEIAQTVSAELGFDNTHYRIDLVFYHRLLRCHVLIELLCCAQHNNSYVA